MYDAESYLIPNPINRYALGDRSGLTYDDNGSLTISIQRDQPERTEANWLPHRQRQLQARAAALFAKARGRQRQLEPPAVERVG